MTSVFWSEIKEELLSGATKKGHPFRYFTLGTVGLDHMARLRTVVLRELTEEMDLLFYTDQRSKKIIHIKENSKVGMLFYHPEKLLQLKVEGLATVHTGSETYLRHREGIDPRGKRDYTTSKAPGSALEGQGPLDYLKEDDYFCVVEVTPFKIEYLRLSDPDHIRVRFSKDQGLWTGEFLVP
ncbi:pyridoxamine 5'-phosphate oxidase family protein [Poritiphilus flavus]|uniref:Pyridoxamine 5'-phosphate oxidase n=1 Tax=Poritiphilus flavus TaxID=2697053 RepID=A0A6L9EB61_9FLAO|nr:pyridoxamine 5'-phosphate oxidase family protein [Poritiphilus flavus]NAS12007.1 pyridoxamine 5'-phosphate oxidase [Poritiphilus flavus]